MKSARLKAGVLTLRMENKLIVKCITMIVWSVIKPRLDLARMPGYGSICRNHVMHLGGAPDGIALATAIMARNDHFETAADWAAAARLVDFEPRRPAFTAGFELVSLAVYVMDHRKRRLPVGARSLEAHYGAFVIDQKRIASATDAKRRALSTPYGSAAETVRVAGFEGRGYALGPEPDADDIDGRSPAVIAWSDGAMFYLVASDQLDEATLLRIASSMYDRDA